MSNLNKGDIIKIYHDPLTEGDLEGSGKLVECMDGNCGYWEDRILQRWYVDFDGQVHLRSILTPTIN